MMHIQRLRQPTMHTDYIPGPKYSKPTYSSYIGARQSAANHAVYTQ